MRIMMIRMIRTKIGYDTDNQNINMYDNDKNNDSNNMNDNNNKNHCKDGSKRTM